MNNLLFISGGEIFIIMVVVLLLFGANKIPEIARGLGKGMREFRKATDDIKREINESSSNIVEDISPQCGGELDSNNFNITLKEMTHIFHLKFVAEWEDNSHSKLKWYRRAICKFKNGTIKIINLERKK